MQFVRPNYQSFLLGLFLVVVLVGTLPFTPRLAFEANQEAEGNLVRQVLFLAFLAAVILPVLFTRPTALLKSIPLSFGLLMGFALLSLLWSPVPDVAARRWALTMIVGIIILVATSVTRPKDALQTFRIVLVFLTLATLVAGFVIPGAVHQPGDPEPSVVGAWRGVFYHKNLAGGVIALAVIFAVDMISREKRWLAGGAFLLLAATALALTGSRTSAVASLLAVIVLLGFRGANALAGDDGTKRVLLHLAIGTAVLSLSAAAWFLSGAASYVADPEAFTGRGVLWREVHTLISSRPLTGWGFESVFQAGDSSPLAQRGGSLWVRAAPHGHNGFLDLLVSIGAVGTLLFAWCFLVQPFRNLARLPYELQRQWSPIIGSLMCFALVHSLMEGRMLAGDSLKYIIFVLLLGLTVRLARTVRD